MPLAYAVLLCLHVLAAAFWVGGMAVMHLAVRPAAVHTLEPPQRLPFMAHTLARFFVGVQVAMTVLLASGLVMIWLAGGFGHVHWSVHAMFAIGFGMMGLFGHIRAKPFKRLQQAMAAREWPVAAANLNRIRQLVGINLLLGCLVIVLAIVARAL
jgi:uncharacterized membrane protein